MKRLFRWISIVVTAVVLGGGIWAATYAYDKGFTKKWRKFVNEEFEKRGIEAKIGKLTLDPVRGLVARDVLFFEDAKREQLLAEVSQIALDIDLAKLIRNQDFLNSVDILNADVSLPLDPDNESGERLEFRDLNARILMPEDKIELKEASGNFYGIRFRLRGMILKPEVDAEPDEDAVPLEPPPSDPASDPASEEVPSLAAQHLKKLQLLRDEILGVVKAVEEIELSDEAPPTIDIQVSGDLEDLAALSAEAHLTSGPLSFRGARCDTIRAQLEYTSQNVRLRHLDVGLEKGSLSASASHLLGTDKILFSIESSADLPPLLGALAKPPSFLSEILFYAPPTLTADGTLQIPSPSDLTTATSDEGSPAVSMIELIGRFESGTVASRGVVLEEISFDFSYRPGAFYLRNALVGHQSGTATFQSIATAEEGLKWKGRIGLDPRVFVPFVNSDGTRKFLNRIDLDEDSSLRVEASGRGPTVSPSSWHVDAHIEARDLKFNGVPIESFEAGFESENRFQIYRDFHVVRKEGTVSGALATYDLDRRITTLSETDSTAEPAALAACFSPKLAAAIREYRFDGVPALRLSGKIDSLNHTDTDLDVSFVSPGAFSYDVLGSPLKFDDVRGRLKFQGTDVGLSLAGKLRAGSEFCHARFSGDADVTLKGWRQKDRSPATDIKIEVRTDEWVYQEFLGRRLPFQDVAADFHLSDAAVDISVTSALYGGQVRNETRFSLEGNPSPAPFSSRWMLTDIRFKDLADAYSQNNETAGNLDAEVELSGLTGEPASLRGGGTASIRDGNIYSVPFLGPLSKLTALALPGTKAGYSIARKASAQFDVADGEIRVLDFEALTPAFRLSSSGTIDYLEDAIDLRARMNVRGAPGFVLFPVSKLFEYRGTGTVRDPEWNSVTLGGITGTNQPREPKRPPRATRGRTPVKPPAAAVPPPPQPGG